MAKGSRSRPGTGRSAASYNAFDLEPFNDFANEALKTIDTFGASLDVIESRMPKVAKLMYNIIGKGIAGTNEQIKQTEEAMKRLDAMLGQQFKELEKRGKAQQKLGRDIGMSLTNAVYKYGKDTRKMYEQLGGEEAAMYEEWNQRRINDMQKETLSKGKLLKAMLFDLTAKETKDALMAPFQGVIDNFQRFNETIAGKTIKYFIPGRKAIKDGFSKAKEWFLKGFQGDIWSNVIKLAVKGITWVVDKFKKILQFDLFDFIQKKWSELKTLIESMPLFQQAKEQWLAIQDAMADVRQQYGGTIANTRELTEAIYAASNAVITVEDNTRALNAVLEAGVSGTERRVMYTEQIALLTKATGVSEQDNLNYLIFANEILGMNEESAFAMAASFDNFTDSLRDTERFVASTDEIMQAMISHKEDLQRMERTGFGTAESLQRDMMALTQWEKSSQVALGTVTDLYAQFGTTEGLDFLGGMLGDPEEVRRRIESGDVAGVMEDFLAHYQDIGASGNALIEEAIQKGLNVNINDLERLSANLDSLYTYTEAAATSQLDFSEALPRTEQSAADSMTTLGALDARLQDVANSFTIGGYRMGEFGELMEVFDTRLGVFTQGFGMAGQASDFLFGPLSPVAKLITGAPLALAAIGGIFGDFSEEFKDFGNLGEFFGFTKEMVDEIWPEIETGLRSMWENIHKYFTDKSYGENGDQTMFGLMVSTGVDWIVKNGPQIITEVTEVATSILDALSVAFETMGDEETGLGSALTTLFVSGLEAAIPLINGAVDVFTNMVKGFLGVMRKVLDDPTIAPAISGFVEDLLSIFSDGMGEAGGVLQSAFETFTEHAGPFFREIGAELAIGMLGILAELDPTGVMSKLLERIIANRTPAEPVLMASTETGGMEARPGSAIRPEGEQGLLWDRYQYPQLDFNQPATFESGGFEKVSPVINTGGPLAGTTMPSIIGVPGEPRGAKGEREHAGYDYILGARGSGNVVGWPVVPFDVGRVAWAGEAGGYGNLVIVEHPMPDEYLGQFLDPTGVPYDRLTVYYAHLGSVSPGIVAGADVDLNTVLGRVGATGTGEGYHLHTEAHLGGAVEREGGSRLYGSMDQRLDMADAYSDVFKNFIIDPQTRESEYYQESALAQLAEGGFVARSATVMVGEGNQNEAVIPLDDWKRDEDRRHEALIQELRDLNNSLSDKLDEIRRATEDYNDVAAAMGAV